MKNIKKQFKKYLLLNIFIFTFLFFVLIPYNNSLAQSTIDILLQTSISGSFSGEGVTIYQGDHITIIYSATGGGVSYCNNPVTGTNGAEGYFNVSPPETIVYTITCYNPSATISASKTIKVTVIMDPSKNIFTKKATNITDTEAKLWGSMIPGDDIKAYFRYSPVSPESITPIFCNDIYGSKMKATKEVLISGNTFRDVYTTINNLSPKTKYWYCIVGSGQNEGQINYGGVESFTTKPVGYNLEDPSSSEGVSITTKNALVLNKNSAYLNGFFNTNTLAETWFEYRKTNFQKIPQNQNISFGEKILNFFSIDKAKAIEIFQYDWSEPVGEKNHSMGTNGDISFLLKGLSAGTNYEFRAVIKTKPSSGFLDLSYPIYYGATKTFTTEGASGSGPGNPFEEDPGVGYEDPCLGSVNDPNCNGTGGGVARNRIGISIGGLPDLIVSSASISSNIVNTPTILSAMVKNQGKNPTSFKNKIENTAPGGNTISFLKNFFKTKIAKAENKKMAVNNVEPGSFYSFFQISTINPNQKNNNAIINFPAIFMSPLSTGNSKTISQNYIFTSSGTYYVRACADKQSPADMGLIKEIYENNNCGEWKETRVGLYNTGNNNENNYENSYEYNNENNYEYNYENNNGNNNGNINYNNLVLGQTVTPPADAVVRYHEGIEHVFVRQIMANEALARAYGYQTGGNLQTFAWDLADILARTFGYIGSNGREIRVSQPDIAAYQLYMNNGILTVYEYYSSVIVNIQRMTGETRNRYEYEYYFNK